MCLYQKKTLLESKSDSPEVMDRESYIEFVSSLTFFPKSRNSGYLSFVPGDQGMVSAIAENAVPLQDLGAKMDCLALFVY